MIYPFKHHFYFTIIATSILIFSSTVLSAQSGEVFRDYNSNGIKEMNEPLLPGVIVNAYLADGTMCGTATTTEFTSPNYTINSCGTAQVRLEFILDDATACKVHSSDFSSQGAASYGSSVQFVNGNDTNINYAISNVEDYNPSTAGTDIFIPCYVNGDPLAGGTAGSSSWFIGFPYGNVGNTAPTYIADGMQIGSVWGVAYSKQAQKVFTSAFIKRHSGLGQLGTGGIYMLEPATTDFNITNFYDLDANGTRTRADDATAPAYGNGTSFSLGGIGNNTISFLGAIDPVSGDPVGLGVVGTNTERGMTSDNTAPNNDAAAFDQVGKVGLGDIDISDDGRYLFVTNLYAKSIVRMELDDPSNPTSVLSVDSYPLSAITNAPSCTDGDLRPFGLKYYKGKLYVGAVCTNEDRATSIPNNPDLSSHVFALDNPTGAASFQANSILSTVIDFDKGRNRGSQVDAFQNNVWNSWTNDWNSAYTKYPVQNVYPTPMLSDIEFTDNGNLVMAFSDRAGHQYGHSNHDLEGTDQIRSYQLGGHLLFAENIDPACNFELENNGSTTNYTGNVGGIGNGEGPGGGEFFSGAFYNNTDPGNTATTPPNPFVGNHPSTAMGSVAILPGTNSLYITTQDPTAFNTGGTFQLNLTDGSKIAGSGYQLYGGGIPFFAKAAGLGDIEFSGELPPVEIGNLVWNDTDNDGVQDADEAGIAGVEVELYDPATMMVIATATTDANGNYIFSTGSGTSNSSFQYGLSLDFATMYELRIVGAEGGSQQSPLTGLEVTAIDNDATMNGDIRDNDGSAGNTSTISFTLGEAGENMHTYDFGFRTAIMCDDPSYTVAALEGSCSGTTANNDASVSLSSVTNGDEAQITAGGSYTGPAYGDPSNMTITGGAASFTGLMHNTMYTVRVWNMDNACFIDMSITTPDIDCTIPCNISSISITSMECVDNSTNDTPSDDRVRVGILVQGTGTASSYTVSVNNGTTISPATGVYNTGSFFELGAGTAGSGNMYTITVVDADDPLCTDTITITAPNNCSPVIPCNSEDCFGVEIEINNN